MSIPATIIRGSSNLNAANRRSLYDIIPQGDFARQAYQQALAASTPLASSNDLTDYFASTVDAPTDVFDERHLQLWFSPRLYQFSEEGISAAYDNAGRSTDLPVSTAANGFPTALDKGKRVWDGATASTQYLESTIARTPIESASAATIVLFAKLTSAAQNFGQIWRSAGNGSFINMTVNGADVACTTRHSSGAVRSANAVRSSNWAAYVWTMDYTSGAMASYTDGVAGGTATMTDAGTLNAGVLGVLTLTLFNNHAHSSVFVSRMTDFLLFAGILDSDDITNVTDWLHDINTQAS